MQNSETCMFCRYRKARIAACCAGHAAAPAQQQGAAQAAVLPPSTDKRERVLQQAPRQEAADTACV